MAAPLSLQEAVERVSAVVHNSFQFAQCAPLHHRYPVSGSSLLPSTGPTKRIKYMNVVFYRISCGLMTFKD